ncbi:MAG: helix-turn-helix transcriptional regulator [Deltaproteobacteria bacterium]|nr:helix-turn-helix transcriptional regulator [Deltaproteobacteria bacterium]
MKSRSQALSKVFYALSDPTRRAVLKHLGSGPASVSELAQPFDMALPSFLQHLQVLEISKLVRSKKAGRIRTYQLTPDPLLAAESWISAQRTSWEKRLNQLDNYLKEMKEKKL